MARTTALFGFGSAASVRGVPERRRLIRRKVLGIS
jgi:hypothetical protein